MDASLEEMSLHSHSDLSHSQDGRAMLHSRDLSAVFPRPSLGGPTMSLEHEHRPPAFDHSMSAVGYSGDSPSGSGSTYTTLTPLQPFDDKFHHHHHHHHPCLPVSNVIGSFTLMREDRAHLGTNFYNPYGKDLAMSQSLSPPSAGAGLGSSMHGYGSLGNGTNGNSNQMLHGGYDVHGGSLFCRTSDFGREMSPPGLGGGDVPVGHQLNKMDAQHGHSHHPHLYSQHYQPHHHPSQQTSKMGEHLHSSSPGSSLSGDSKLPGGGGSGGEEINTRDVAQRIITELKRYSIPQAIFAERVLSRSQGTLSDLLRNPKPWGKLKSGRETFKRMSRWLQEPEFQRMASLRLEGKIWLCTQPTTTNTLLHTRALLAGFPQTPCFSMSSKKFSSAVISMQLRSAHEEKQKDGSDVSLLWCECLLVSIVSPAQIIRTQHRTVGTTCAPPKQPILIRTVVTMQNTDI